MTSARERSEMQGWTRHTSAVRRLWLPVIGAAAAVALVAPQGAAAAIDSVLDGSTTCTTQSDGVRFCEPAPDSRPKTFDGVPIDVNVAFPPAPASGADGPYPLIMIFHGYGGEKLGLEDMKPFLDRGYAAFSMTDRGFHESCGSADSRALDPAGCANGYVRLLDTRYEVRDAQEFAGQLADEGLIDPQRIGATGGSYGGGMSMALGALVDRKMLPDGSLVAWTSPDGKPMKIAAAAPNIPWTDLAYSLQPNGRTLDYVDDAPYKGPVGVEKQAFVNGLYLSGLIAPGYYSAPGQDPDADLTGWKTKIEMGEPYEGSDVQSILDELTSHHSSYYIDHSQPPAPLLISNGYTDDLFPVDEAVRFYHRTIGQYPDADIALFFGDFGHQRAQNKDDVSGALQDRVLEWMDHFVKGDGPAPAEGVTAYTETCPSDAPSGGPYTAGDYARLAPGELRLQGGPTQTIEPDAGDPAIGKTFGDVTAADACATAPGDDQPGTANYRLDPAPAGGYTLLGAATVNASFGLTSDTSQVAARLLDVGPDGRETLVSRGLWRPEMGTAQNQVFQLHPGAWTFEEGHVAKLELLPSDSGDAALNTYGRPSDGQGPVEVSDLRLSLPLAERPGSIDGLVKAPAPKTVPDGYALSADFAALPYPQAKVVGKLKVRGKRLRAKVKCPAAFAACNDGDLRVRAKGAGKKGRPNLVAKKKGFDDVAGGKRAKVRMKLTRKARRYFADHRRLKVKTKTRSTETIGAKKQRKKAVAR